MRRTHGLLVVVMMVVGATAGSGMAATSYQFHNLGWIGQANAVSGGIPAGVRQQGASLQPVIYSGGTIRTLNTGGYTNDMIQAASAGQYAGAGTSAGGTSAALYWPSASGAPVNLNPAGYYYSRVLGMDAAQQVGAASLTGPYLSDHALLWSGSAGSVVDLNPTNLQNAASVANDTYGGYQIGTVWSVQQPQAVLWHGTASSWMSLTPSGYLASNGTAIWANHQVGIAWQGSPTSPMQRAILWSGTAASAVDITPVGYRNVAPTDICGDLIAGHGDDYASDLSHALLWTDLGTNLVDLQAVTPAPYMLSVATGVDEAGNVVGYVGQNVDGDYTYYAAMWTPQPVQPEPVTLSLLAIGAACATRCRSLRR